MLLYFEIKISQGRNSWIAFILHQAYDEKKERLHYYAKPASQSRNETTC